MNHLLFRTSSATILNGALTLKMASRIVADDNLTFLNYFSEKIRLGISLFRQLNDMKCQVIFSENNNKKIKLLVSSAAVLFLAL